MLNSLMTRSAIIAFACGLSFSAHAVAEAPTRIDVPAGELITALELLVKQADIELVYRAEQLAGIRTNGLSGTYAPREAVSMLIQGTQLVLRTDEATGVMLIAAPSSASDGKNKQPAARASDSAASSPPTSATDRSFRNRFRMAQAGPSSRDAAPGEDQRVAGGGASVHEPAQLEEIVVTGTTIRGVVPQSSPLTVYSSEEIRKTGATSLEQFIAKLPQNLGSLTSSAIGAIAGEFNAESVNAIDLRGLGVGTTLVLLNGRRLAPAAGARTPDVALIPMSLVERVEVLTDGASAIYGADAVGGVVNFILRDELDGAQTTLGAASVTDGDMRELRAEQSIGRDWGSGHGLLAYTWLDRTDLDASERAYALPAAPYALSPKDRRHNLLASIEQETQSGFTLFADAFASLRETGNRMKRRTVNVGVALEDLHNDTEQYFANVGARRALGSSIHAELVASWSRYENVNSFDTWFSDGGRNLDRAIDETKTFDVTAKLDGRLLSMPGGPLMFSLGAGFSRDRYDRTHYSGRVSVADRDTNYVFGELLLPLVGPGNALPGVQRLELSVAGRYTHYSDFGGEASPKVGLSWQPLTALRVRGTYGKSFRAPFLSQIDPNDVYYSLFRLADYGFPDAWSDDNSSVMLFVGGNGNPFLMPEQARSWTAGLDLTPASLPGLQASATWFSVKYTDRIAFGDPAGGFGAVVAPQNFPDLFFLDPTAEQVAALIGGARNTINDLPIDPTDPQAIAAMVNVVMDNRLRNLSYSELDGLDLAINYGRALAAGDLRLGTQLTYLFDYTQKTTRNAPVLPRVNTLFGPVDLRVRTFVSYAVANWSGQLNVNYVDNYTNQYEETPAPVDSWTTVDVSIGYDFGAHGAGFASGLRLALNIQNVLDEDPPFVNLTRDTNLGLTEPVGFDPTNANPLGRFVSLEVSKAW